MFPYLQLTRYGNFYHGKKDANSKEPHPFYPSVIVPHHRFVWPYMWHSISAHYSTDNTRCNIVALTTGFCEQSHFIKVIWKTGGFTAAGFWTAGQKLEPVEKPGKRKAKFRLTKNDRGNTMNAGKPRRGGLHPLLPEGVFPSGRKGRRDCRWLHMRI